MNKKITITLISALFFSPLSLADSVERGLCYVPKYKETFISERERSFYYLSIERTQRCVEHIVKTNDAKIAELRSQIEELEMEKENTTQKWNDFVAKIKKG